MELKEIREEIISLKHELTEAIHAINNRHKAIEIDLHNVITMSTNVRDQFVSIRNEFNECRDLGRIKNFNAEVRSRFQQAKYKMNQCLDETKKMQISIQKKLKFEPKELKNLNYLIKILDKITDGKQKCTQKKSRKCSKMVG